MEQTRREFLQTGLTLLLTTPAVASSTHQSEINQNHLLQRIQESYKTYHKAPWIHDAIKRVSTYAKHFETAEDQHQVSKYYLAGICMKETMGNPYLISSKGALGLMQVMPSTARGMGYTPQQIFARKNSPQTQQQTAIKSNIHCAAKYMNYTRTKIMQTYPEKTRPELGLLTIAAYAGGLGTVQDIMRRTPHFTNLSNDSALHKYVIRVNALTQLVSENRHLFGYTT